MHVSQKQLARWVTLDVWPTAQQLADDLTMVGLEVEELREIGAGCDDIVVGRIDAIEDHEKADKLVICRVDVGDGRQRQIVCGARNMAAGDLVPVALPGSQPPALDFQIGERKVLGVLSEGMLCAEEELGLADSSDGLWILPADLTLGTPVFEAMGLVDAHLEIGLTPNRPDCLSHLGVAREVAALYGGTLTLDALDLAPAWEDGQGAIGDATSLQVDDAEGCPRYLLAVVENVQVGPSPAWLRDRVRAMGMRSINNLVDVTNFVLADIGQPLHVFDLDQLDGGRIVVRRARDGESMEAIDHKIYNLDARDLVIADASKPVAIAGVMGGSHSEVTEQTTRVLLECAYFDPTTVRKTAKRLGIHSESSHRFERGIDPAATLRNAAYALSLILQTQADNADVRVRNAVLEHNAADTTQRTIAFDAGRIERILGLQLPTEEVERILAAVGANATATDTGWDVTVPTYRPDLERPIDLVEEVARLHGFQHFGPTLPRGVMGADHIRKPDGHPPTILARHTRREIHALRQRLLATGLHEALSFTFMNLAELDRLQLASDDPRRTAAVRIANPLTSEFSHMRTTMVPAMLRALEVNVAQRARDIGLFELSRVFDLSGERETLALLVTGAQSRHYSGDRLWDLASLKGLLESLLGADAARSVWDVPTDLTPYLHPGVQATWSLDGVPLGLIGQLHPAVIDADVEAPVFVAEVDVESLLSRARAPHTFTPFPRYPAVKRDFALLVDVDAPYGNIVAALHDLARRDPQFGRLFEEMHLFDVYQGAQIPDGKRSIALQVVYRSSERTLADDDIRNADNVLLDALAEHAGATLR